MDLSLDHGLNEKEVANILKETKSNTWNLISYKEMHGMDMIQAFYVVSPNGHPTVLVFANNSDASYYAISNKLVYMSFDQMFESSVTSVKSSSAKSKTEQKKTLEQEFTNEEVYQKFFEKIIKAFDEQLCFFDEEIPLKCNRQFSCIFQK